MSTKAINNQPAQLASQTFTEQLRGQGHRLNAKKEEAEGGELREAFDDFVGQTFYGLMMKTMRESQQKNPYFHGGRGEEVFQKQLDQVLVERMADASAETFTEPMFELFSMRRA